MTHTRKRVVSETLQKCLDEINTPEYKERRRKEMAELKERLDNVKGRTKQKDIEDLHLLLVNTICQFCKERELYDIDVVQLRADGLMGSTPYGKWEAATDSNIQVYGVTIPTVDTDYPFPEKYQIGCNI